MMTNTPTNPNDDLPAEIDFSKGKRGKFYHAQTELNLPVNLDQEVQAYLTTIAAKKGMQLSDLANDLLKREIGIIEVVK
jgi:hypothetical protein